MISGARDPPLRKKIKDTLGISIRSKTTHTRKSPYEIKQAMTKLVVRIVTTTNTRETYRCKCNSNTEHPLGILYNFFPDVCPRYRGIPPQSPM
jgi:hypothetical protein